MSRIVVVLVLVLGACRGGAELEADAGDGGGEFPMLVEQWEDACIANCERDAMCGNEYNCELFCAARAELLADVASECVEAMVVERWCYAEVDCEDDQSFMCEDEVRARMDVCD